MKIPCVDPIAEEPPHPYLCSLILIPYLMLILPCSDLQIWVKPGAEMQFLYGNNILKSGLGRITESTPGYTGVVIYSMADIPLGFGLTAKSTNECRTMDPSGVVCFHQADVGEWLRSQDEL
jgi:60S ribosome subunit biogenesis protein NIP7